jgi:hypothetical protein
MSLKWEGAPKAKPEKARNREGVSIRCAALIKKQWTDAPRTREDTIHHDARGGSPSHCRREAGAKQNEQRSLNQ